MNMRLDYTLYVLGVALLIITAVPFIAPISMETAGTSVRVVASVVLGLFSIGLGYSQRPKTEGQACQSEMPVPQETISETQLETPMEEPKKEKSEAPMEKPAMIQTAQETSTFATSTLKLTQVKGIGEKRATQLKALGINSVDDLTKASAKTVAKKLKISPKTVGKWVASAKELVE
jgi:predicted flap endonuclease-1-like 5' DNA nuclease